LFDATGITIAAGSVGASFAAVGGLFVWIDRESPRRVSTSVSLGSWRDGWWLILPAIALVSISARALIDPLAGYDTGFRWDYLAHMVLERGSFSGYPPITAADFEHYAWCDGIPPLVSLLNFWIYAFCRTTAPEFIAIRIGAEALLLGLVVYRYAALLWGKPAARLAPIILVASPLALWSIGMGQETGLTALSLVSMLYFLELYRAQKQTSSLFWAGLAAGVGAATREYGLSFPLLGLGILAVRRTKITGLGLMTASSLGFSLPWYVRNWIVTGNPLYPQALGGLFPSNAIHQEWMRYVAEFWGLSKTTLQLSDLPLILAALSGIPIVLGAAGLWRRGARALLVSLAIVIALWLWSIHQTAGGWIYSMRMLLPGIALLAVAAAWICTLPQWPRLLLLGVVALGALDSARRSWLIPEYALDTPLSASFAGWRETHRAIERISAAKAWQVLVQASRGESIAVDQPLHHSTITRLGGSSVPLFSPSLASSFDERLSPTTIIARLRACHIRFVVVSFRDPYTNRLAGNHRFWGDLKNRYVCNAVVGPLEIFDLAAMTLKSTETNNSALPPLR